MQGERSDIAPLQERFCSRFEAGPTDVCWMWTGKPNGYGYGRMKAEGKEYLAHRLAYEFATGTVIPSGMQVDHVCHTTDTTCPGGKCAHRLCVNPAHLEVVTGPENTRRRDLIQRRTECQNGHPLEGENLYEWTGRDGYARRACKACRAETSRRARA